MAPSTVLPRRIPSEATRACDRISAILQALMAVHRETANDVDSRLLEMALEQVPIVKGFIAAREAPGPRAVPATTPAVRHE